MSTQLSDNDLALLAREAAADSYRATGFVYDGKQVREAFSAGWEAAVEWMRAEVEGRRALLLSGLDDDGQR